MTNVFETSKFSLGFRIGNIQFEKIWFQKNSLLLFLCTFSTFKFCFQKPSQDDKEKENSFPSKTTRRQESRQKSVAGEDDKKSEAGTQDGGSGRTTSRVGQIQGQNIIVPPPPFQFSDPCPQSMRHVRIGELSSVDINWKMLTLARPTSKIDEDIFSKFVDLFITTTLYVSSD